MSTPDQLVFALTNLEQVGMVVRDIQKSMEKMWNDFRIGPWDIYTRSADLADSDLMTNMTYYGKPARFSFKIARTHNKVGGYELELIETIQGDTVYNDFLKEHGEGIHHVGWHVVDSSEAFDETWQRLEKAGFPCVMSADSPRVRFGYFDTTKSLKTLLEVVYRNSTVSILPNLISVFPKKTPKNK